MGYDKRLSAEVCHGRQMSTDVENLWQKKNEGFINIDDFIGHNR